VTVVSACQNCRDDPDSDVDLKARKIQVGGTGGRVQTVKISHDAARRLDRYLRVRSGHELAYRPGCCGCRRTDPNITADRAVLPPDRLSTTRTSSSPRASR
jgi:integrase